MHSSDSPKISIVVWTDFSPEKIRKLEELTDSESINNCFMKIFHLEPHTKRTTILCDLFYYALNFARTNKFNPEQISTFLSILKRVHDTCIRTSFANMEETYQYFKVLMLKHSLSRPPYYLRIFTPDVTKKATDYIVDTYFRHFKMYKYVFTATIDFHLHFTYEGMTRQVPETEKQEEEQQPFEIAETLDFSTVTNNEVKQEESNPQLIEIRKLIETYVREEIRKSQNPIEEQEATRPPAEKQRPTKSGSGKPSKPHTPK